MTIDAFVFHSTYAIEGGAMDSTPSVNDFKTANTDTGGPLVFVWLASLIQDQVRVALQGQARTIIKIA